MANLQKVSFLQEKNSCIPSPDVPGRADRRFSLIFSSADYEDVSSSFDFLLRVELTIFGSFGDESEERRVFSSEVIFGLLFDDAEGLSAGPDVILPAWPVLRENLLANCRRYEVATPPLPFTLRREKFSTPSE